MIEGTIKSSQINDYYGMGFTTFYTEVKVDNKEKDLLAGMRIKLSDKTLPELIILEVGKKITHEEVNKKIFPLTVSILSNDVLNIIKKEFLNNNYCLII